MADVSQTEGVAAPVDRRCSAFFPSDLVWALEHAADVVGQMSGETGGMTRDEARRQRAANSEAAARIQRMANRYAKQHARNGTWR